MRLDEEVIRTINSMYMECDGNASEAKRRLEDMGINIGSMTIIHRWRAKGYETGQHGGRRNFKTSKERELTERDIKIIIKYLERYEGFPAKEIRIRIRLGENESYKVEEIVKVREGNYPLEGRL